MSILQIFKILQNFTKRVFYIQRLLYGGKKEELSGHWEKQKLKV